jgi:hypothetical protein
MAKQLIKSDTPPLKTEDGDAYDIPENGSLGLLAMGYVGIMLWRNKRALVKNKREATKTNNIIS